MKQPFWFDYPPDRPMACRHCSWEGPFGALSSELFSEVIEYDCPACSEIVIVFGFPSFAEVRAAAEAGNAQAIAEMPHVESAERTSEEMKRSKLKSADALPALDLETPTIFVWDQPQPLDGKEWTVVRLAGTGREVFRERTYWEGYRRFMEVRDWLRTRYGQLFADLVPTERATMYLGGDSLSAWEIMGDPRIATPEEAPWTLVPDLASRAEVDGDAPGLVQ